MDSVAPHLPIGRGGAAMRPIKYLLDQDGNPYPVDDLDAWAENWDRQRAATRLLDLVDLPEGGTVSTIFMGIDHNLLGKGPPVLWETMVFEGAFDGMCKRWHTQQEAREGHAWMIAHMTRALSLAAPQGAQ